MEGTSKDDLFTVDESKDEKTIDATPIKGSGGGNSNGDCEALMAALGANREWLQAKVSINNALIMDATTKTPPRHGDFFCVGECEGQKTIDGEQTPLVLTPATEEDKDHHTSHEALA